MRSALEEKLKSKIPRKRAVTLWLIRHAGYLIARCRIRPNGRTALQMLKGRRPNGKLAEFSELVHFLIPKTKEARAYGWDVMYDHGNISSAWSVGFSKYRR